ncbi:GNAT family N-acetyltransferase [Rufibacter sediminis]|uniref:N-acetyltransferase n=1 Tax=Rufibacter sediminis TaxID=2762756 RepID=A0ABR6VN25_9BACT|nr:GNAT family N-acetyltransferase [Rufibacter sediminis]MBC3538591.1 N-acetyltransferase [Rufibacter sediminis]
MDKTDVIHDEEDLRFYMELEGEEAELTYSITENQELDLDYTFVPESHRNQGLADKLVKTALEYVKAKNLTFVASCPVVETYVKRHPEYQSFLAQE